MWNYYTIFMACERTNEQYAMFTSMHRWFDISCSFNSHFIPRCLYLLQTFAVGFLSCRFSRKANRIRLFFTIAVSSETNCSLWNLTILFCTSECLFFVTSQTLDKWKDNSFLRHSEAIKQNCLTLHTHMMDLLEISFICRCVYILYLINNTHICRLHYTFSMLIFHLLHVKFNAVYKWCYSEREIINISEFKSSEFTI